MTTYEEVAANLNLFRGFLCAAERAMELGRLRTIETSWLIASQFPLNLKIMCSAYRRFSRQLQTELDNGRLFADCQALYKAFDHLSLEEQVRQSNDMWLRLSKMIEIAQEHLESVMHQLCNFGCVVPCDLFPATKSPEPFKVVHITQEDATDIQSKRIPYGLFILTESEGVVVGIDNTTGDAWTEDFSSEEDCLTWLTKCSEHDLVSEQKPVPLATSYMAIHYLHRVILCLDEMKTQELTVQECIADIQPICRIVLQELGFCRSTDHVKDLAWLAWSNIDKQDFSGTSPTKRHVPRPNIKDCCTLVSDYLAIDNLGDWDTLTLIWMLGELFEFWRNTTVRRVQADE